MTPEDGSRPVPSPPSRSEEIGALLVQHAERILEQLTALDERWAGEVRGPSPNRVVLHTTWDGGPAPAMRVSDLIASPSERAFLLHESKVGKSTARRDQERLTRHEEAGSGWARRKRRNAQERQRLADNPERRERQNAKSRERRRARRANDPEWRERQNAHARKRRERENTRKRARRANDPEWRERENAQARKRWAGDPERRERENARKRERRRRL